jgi:DNA polymerase-3 subunit delta'
MTPKPFSEIIGQRKAVRFLQRAIASKKVPHAYLFTGIAGIGKTTTAMSLAMALNCLNRVGQDSCGRCRPCRQMQNGNHPDFITIKPTGQNIRIEQIRELNRQLSFAPVSGSYRICLIHHAKTLSDEAANSFLKTLEEPLPGNILILKAKEPMDLLPTIVSRCQKVAFQPIAVDEISEWLMDVQGIAEEDVDVLAKLSGGSLGLAVRMKETGFLDKRQDWFFKLGKLPGLSAEQALNMALEFGSYGSKTTLELSEEAEVGMADFFGSWQSWYRDLLAIKSNAPPDLLMNSDFSHKMNAVARNFTINQLADSVLILDRAKRDLQRNQNATLVLEHTVLSLKDIMKKSRDRKIAEKSQ